MNTLMKRDGKYPSTLRNDLFSPFESVFDDFFNDFFKGTSALDRVRANSGYPKMDVIEQDGKLVLNAALPGVKYEDIKIEMLDDSTVEISGHSSEDRLINDKVYHLRELSKRSFTRRLNLPQDIGDPESAKIKDGILTLVWSLPEKEKEPERRFIEVKQE